MPGVKNLNVVESKLKCYFTSQQMEDLAMKKRIVTLMTVVCLTAAPLCVTAEETDYSYLEDMSVRELKELRNEIDKILGDEETISSVTEGIEESAEKLLEVCPPYQTTGAYEEPDSFIMGGDVYTGGFTMQHSATAQFNLKGQYQTLSFDLGHVDGARMDDDTFSVFLDGKLVQVISANADALPETYTVDVSGAKLLTIQKDHTITYANNAIVGDYYGFGNLYIY